MNYPKVLVIANQSFSLTNSNGRTLGGFFIGWPKEKLAQFCIGTEGPNFEICDNYYCITDRSMLNACLHFRKPARQILNPDIQMGHLKNTRSVRKSAFVSLVRYFIWMSRKWNNKDLNQWLQDFNPDIILFQSGDTTFMLDIALEISKKRQIPLVVFNTEANYFFKHNYFSKGICDFLFFPLYHTLYKRKYRELMRNVKFSIYGNY